MDQIQHGCKLRERPSCTVLLGLVESKIHVDGLDEASGPDKGAMTFMSCYFLVHKTSEMKAGVHFLS